MPSVAEPLTAPELRMLHAYAEGDAAANVAHARSSGNTR